jgi:hypothetical protein
MKTKSNLTKILCTFSLLVLMISQQIEGGAIADLVGWVEERNPTQPTVTFLKVNSTTQLSTKMFQFN